MYIFLQSTDTNIKVYSQPAPQSTDRVVAIGGKPPKVVDAVATIMELLETVSCVFECPYLWKFFSKFTG